jgi:hypothetical protein
MENNWFKSYLNSRNQKCFVNGCLSQNRFLSCGIPQGTILGPLLFILYINDLPNCLSYTQPRMYADDTNLSFASDSIDVIAYKLTLNKSKSEFMLIGSRQRLRTFEKSPSLVINGASLKRVSNCKSLGVTIDENLSWSEHIDRLCKKIASGIGAIKRTRTLFPTGRCN